jgi:hypothetical protein
MVGLITLRGRSPSEKIKHGVRRQMPRVLLPLERLPEQCK